MQENRVVLIRDYMNAYQQGVKAASAYSPGMIFYGAWNHPACPTDEGRRRMFTMGYLEAWDKSGFVAVKTITDPYPRVMRAEAAPLFVSSTTGQ